MKTKNLKLEILKIYDYFKRFKIRIPSYIIFSLLTALLINASEDYFKAIKQIVKFGRQKT